MADDHGTHHVKSKNFSELTKVRSNEQFGSVEGYVVDALFRDGRWIYKISISETKTDIFDNWIPEDCLEKIS